MDEMRARIAASFQSQSFMQTLGAELACRGGRRGPDCLVVSRVTPAGMLDRPRSGRPAAAGNAPRGLVPEQPRQP